MANTPDPSKRSGKSPGSKVPKSKTPKSKAHRPEVQPIGPALAELLNPAINRGDAGVGSGTGLQPPPDNSWDRRSGGEAAAHRARKSTPKDFPAPQSSAPDSSVAAKRGGVRADPRAGFHEAPQAALQANYGTAATIPTMD